MTEKDERWAKWKDELHGFMKFMRDKPRYYKLEGHKAVPIENNDVIEFAQNLETVDRQVALTRLADGVEVSTVFLGLDHNWLGDERGPQIFETAVFGFAPDNVQIKRRYSTWDEAAAGHEKIVAAIRAAWN